jgi:hypothetical protein
MKHKWMLVVVAALALTGSDGAWSADRKGNLAKKAVGNAAEEGLENAVKDAAKDATLDATLGAVETSHPQVDRDKPEDAGDTVKDVDRDDIQDARRERGDAALGSAAGSGIRRRQE